MKTVLDHLERVKGQPHHVKKQVLFAAAGTGTALVALVWLAGNLAFGTFAITGNSFADSVAQSQIAVEDRNAGANNFAGVAAAVADTSAPARIQIVDAASSTRTTKPAEPTTIPF